MSPSSSSQTCVVCGDDVSSKPRTHSAQGYYCRTCYEQAREDQRLARTFGEPVVPPPIQPNRHAPPIAPVLMHGAEALAAPLPGSVPVEQREGATWVLAPLLLFVRPSRFFRLFVVTPAPLLTALFAWMYGMAGAMDRMDSRITTAQIRGRPFSFPDHWAAHWTMFVIGGILAGVLYAWLGGWWYRLRLKWSGVESPDWAMTRRVYLTASAIWAIPMLLDRFGDTFAFAKPSDALNADLDTVDVLVMLALFWSIWISYVGVRVVFAAARWRAVVLFLALPALLYLVVFAGGVTIAYLLASAPPNLTSPASHQAPRFAFRYPSNWTIDTTDPDYDPDGDMRIDALQDAGVHVMFYESAESPTDELAMSADAVSAMFLQPREMGAMDRWGAFEGTGRIISGEINGSTCTYRLFVCEVQPGAFLEVWEYASDADWSTAEPGFQLIRASMRAH